MYQWQWKKKSLYESSVFASTVDWVLNHFQMKLGGRHLAVQTQPGLPDSDWEMGPNVDEREHKVGERNPRDDERTQKQIKGEES